MENLLIMGKTGGNILTSGAGVGEVKAMMIVAGWIAGMALWLFLRNR